MKPKPKRRKVCVWTPYDDDINLWSAACGDRPEYNLWSLTNGTPTENGMRFCLYCGLPIRERKETT